jgi:phosphoribosylformylglycinamidine cyclo-ligase
VSEGRVHTRVAYARSGVDVEAADRAVHYLRSHVLSTGALPATGGTEFGAAVEIPEHLRRPLLVTSTDGVGTKTEIARRLGRFDTIGQDLVAMCADDVVCHGAQPAYFLDYLSIGRLDERRVADLVGGIGRACEEVGCALVGGETAEHPGVMDEDAFDLAGFCIGFVERDEMIDNSAAQPGDVIVGMASSGLHSNGYSLVRRLVDDGLLPLADELLTPTRLYAPAVLELIAVIRGRGLRIGGLAHVTGGGVARNLPRAVGIGLGVRVRPADWPQPPIFESIRRAADIDAAELRATFNCGIGMAAVVEPAAAELAVETIRNAGIDAWQIGEVRPLVELGADYVEA